MMPTSTAMSSRRQTAPTTPPMRAVGTSLSPMINDAVVPADVLLSAAVVLRSALADENVLSDDIPADVLPSAAVVVGSVLPEDVPAMLLRAIVIDDVPVIWLLGTVCGAQHDTFPVHDENRFFSAGSAAATRHDSDVFGSTSGPTKLLNARSKRRTIVSAPS